MDEFKKIQELIILQNFRKHYPGFPRGKLIKFESPDFILRPAPNFTIGIELTALPTASYKIFPESLPFFIKDIQTSVTKKTEKLDLYRKIKANEYWLVIYADSIELDGSVIFENELHLNNNQAFNKIFLFDLFDGRIWNF